MMNPAPRIALVIVAALMMISGGGGCVGPCSTPIVLLPIGWLLDGKPCTDPPAPATRPVVGTAGLPVTQIQIDRAVGDRDERDHQ
jgi:hypothetical protein